MVYNLSLINGTGIVSLTQTVNQELMFGWFGPMLLLTIFLITFISMVQFSQDARRSFSYASTITAIMSLPVSTLQLASEVWVFGTWIMAAISIFFLFLKE